ncbi:MAG: HEAT repeat domain-containing protein [Candidatus Marinimicrobia bacterium]|nr:HEAT repeat domain-containing protein [Candidatus Neomarinimicrobiota bacterium]
MKHNNKYNKMLTLYFYDELNAAEKEVFEEHLKSCEQCQLELEKMESLKTTLDSIPDKKPSAALLTRMNNKVMNRIEAKEESFLVRVKDKLLDLKDRFSLIMAQPKYHLASIGIALFLGVIIGKIWLSTNLKNDPQAIRSFVSNTQAFSEEQEENFNKAFVDYVFKSDNIEVGKLLKNNKIETNENGIVNVNFELKRELSLKGGLDDPTIQKMLMYSAVHDSNPERREHAIKLLSHLADKKHSNKYFAETFGAVLLRDSSITNRNLALEVLKDFKPNDKILEIFKTAALNDPNPEIRAESIQYLGNCKQASNNVRQVLAAVYLRDSTHTVKAAAKQALNSLKDNAASQDQGSGE